MCGEKKMRSSKRLLKLEGKLYIKRNHKFNTK